MKTELKIEELIKERGLTFDQVADMVGMTRQSLRNVMLGNPTLTSLEKVASALDVAVHELFRHEQLIYCPHCGKPIRVESTLEKAFVIDDKVQSDEC